MCISTSLNFTKPSSDLHKPPLHLHKNLHIIHKMSIWLPHNPQNLRISIKPPHLHKTTSFTKPSFNLYIVHKASTAPWILHLTTKLPHHSQNLHNPQHHWQILHPTSKLSIKLSLNMYETSTSFTKPPSDLHIIHITSTTYQLSSKAITLPHAELWRCEGFVDHVEILWIMWCTHNTTSRPLGPGALPPSPLSHDLSISIPGCDACLCLL